MNTEVSPAGSGTSHNTQQARIDSIDATRGVALFLILFSHCLQGFFSTRNLSGGGAADDFCLAFCSLFVIHKCMMLFALLFGLSFFFQLKKASSQGSGGTGRFLSRLGWLAVFGCINSVFDRNDMLLPFAACGLALPLVRHLSTRWVLALAALLLCHPPELLHAVLGIPDSLQHFLNIHLQTEACTQSSTWLDLTAWNLAYRIPWVFSHLYITYRIFDVPGMFLLGYCLGRSRIFEPQNAKRLLILCSGLAGTLCLGFTARHFATWEESSFNLAQSCLDTVQTLFYAAFFTLLFRARCLAWLCSPMAAIGKSTLSCYMAQGVILSFLMYGWGLGWAETMGASSKAILAVAVFLLQMLSCILILKKHPLCPMEMLWRRLVAHSRRA